MNIKQYILSFLILSSISLNAQLLDKNFGGFTIDEMLTRNVIAYENRERIETSILMEDNLRKMEDNKLYYWYRKEEIHNTQGGFSGNLLHGDYEIFYKSGQLKVRGEFNQGLKHGKWVKWNEKGRITEILFWKSGIPDGPFITYSERGMIKKCSVFKNNEEISCGDLKKKEEKRIRSAYEINELGFE